MKLLKSAKIAPICANNAFKSPISLLNSMKFHIKLLSNTTRRTV